MRDDAKKRVYEEALKRWGTDAQLNMAIEECAELTEEICHYFRARCSLTGIACEVADVEIMIEQLRLIVGETAVDEIKERKLMRLAERLRDDAQGDPDDRPS